MGELSSSSGRIVMFHNFPPFLFRERRLDENRIGARAGKLYIQNAIRCHE